MAAVTMSSGVLPFIGWHAQTLAAEPQAQITRHIQVKTSTLPQADVSDGPRSVTHAFTLVQVLDAVAAFYPSLVAARTEARASA